VFTTDNFVVPTYDGTASGFNIGNWWESKNTRKTELMQTSAVMVFFTCRGSEYSGKQGLFNGITMSLGLNVLAVVAVNEDLKVIRDPHELHHTGDEFYGVDNRRQIDELDTVIDEIL
jgi:hypothetical protein